MQIIFYRTKANNSTGICADGSAKWSGLTAEPVMSQSTFIQLCLTLALVVKTRLSATNVLSDAHVYKIHTDVLMFLFHANCFPEI